VDYINYTFSVYQNGTVTATYNNNQTFTISETGGETDLNQWITNHSSQLITYTIENVVYNFNLYGNSSVIDSNGVVICETGG